MSDSNKINLYNYSKFDNMSTDALEEILRLDCQLPDDEESDVNAILYITEVIEKREKEHATDRFTDVHTAWASFKNNYLPYTEDGKSLYDFEDTDTHFDIKQTPFEKFLHQHRKRQMKRVAGITATLIVILLTGTLTTNALGFDLWGAVARWTKDTFGFSSSVPRETISDAQDSNDEDKFESLKQALDYYGVTAKLAPTWLPDVYLLEKVEVDETPVRTTINAVYTHKDDEIAITIILLTRPLTSTYEKDGEEVTVYPVNNVDHYIMTNLSLTNIVWENGNYECSIMGHFSLEEAKKMIASIYKGE